MMHDGDRRRSVAAALLALILVALSHSRSFAAPITWESSSTVSHVVDTLNFWPGLTVGTPLKLTITFDPSTPGQLIPFGGAAAPCYKYATGSATLNLGGYTYTKAATGQDGVYTNFQFPEVGCTGLVAPSEPTLVTFLFFGGWTQEAGAWNLNSGSPSFLVASYYELLHTDGSLPSEPTFNPNPGQLGGSLRFDADLFPGGPKSQFSSFFHPEVIPEPATIALFGAGLVVLIARRKQGSR